MPFIRKEYMIFFSYDEPQEDQLPTRQYIDKDFYAFDEEGIPMGANLQGDQIPLLETFFSEENDFEARKKAASQKPHELATHIEIVWVAPKNQTPIVEGLTQHWMDYTSV